MKTRAGWLLLILLIPAVAGLFRLRFETDVLQLLPDDVPSVAGLKLYQQAFGGRQEVLATISAQTSEAAEETARRVANLAGRAVWQPPWLESAEATAELLAWLWLSQPPETVSSMVARLRGENLPAILEETKARLATSLSPLDLARLGHDPFGLTQLTGVETMEREWFSSEDGMFRVVFIQPARELKGLADWENWLRDLRSAIGNENSVGLTGPPVFMVETATGMRGDMKQSVAFTLFAIAGLFWWAHRQFRALGWMLLMLALAVAITMGLGGFVFGTLNVVSFGFAAILLGLGVDYALVAYQEFIDMPPGATAKDVRAAVAGGIWWSAGTTALAFALLNFAGLPGLGELGTLVAIGILIAAAVMLHGFLPIATRQPRAAAVAHHPQQLWTHQSGWVATLVLLVISATLAAIRWPTIDRASDVLDSRSSEAARVAREMERRMNRDSETAWLLARGRDETEVRRMLEAAASELQSAGVNAELPLALWPDPERQKINRPLLRELAGRFDELARAAEAAGFTADAMDLSRGIFRAWAASAGEIWPRDPSIRWLVDRIAARVGGEWVALGMIRANPSESLPVLKTPGVTVAGWGRLAGELLAKVERRITWLTAAIAAVLAVCLRLALRGWREVLLSFATLVLGFVMMIACMSIFGWRWNLLNLTVIPLLLGAGVDYTIHVQRALRRLHGDTAAMRRTIGRALFLLTAAAVAGFGSLGLSSNAGWASFELLCALGMICIFVSALYLLPSWHYSWVTKRNG